MHLYSKSCFMRSRSADPSHLGLVDPLGGVELVLLDVVATRISTARWKTIPRRVDSLEPELNLLLGVLNRVGAVACGIVSTSQHGHWKGKRLLNSQTFYITEEARISTGFEETNARINLPCRPGERSHHGWCLRESAVPSQLAAPIAGTSSRGCF
jgi:hypothetical protein